jgi:selenide,water dikinase
MGAEAVSAMAIAVVPFAAEHVVENELKQMMAGACDVLEKDGCALVGGHTSEGMELGTNVHIYIRICRALTTR